MSGFAVVDASLAFKWLVREEHSDKALAILRMWHNEEVYAGSPPPAALRGIQRASQESEPRRAERLRRRLTLSENLLTSQIELHQPWNLHGKALEMASRFGQGAAYDAHYLALAENLGCELWTADEKFHQSVGQEMGHVRWIGEFVA